MRKAAKVYDYAIRSILPLCAAGFLIALIGGRPWAYRTGGALFLLGAAVWGFANGGAFVWGFFRTLHRYGFREFTSHPWSSALFLVLMIFLVSCGAWFLWLAFRASVSR